MNRRKRSSNDEEDDDEEEEEECAEEGFDSDDEDFAALPDRHQQRGTAVVRAQAMRPRRGAAAGPKRYKEERLSDMEEDSEEGEEEAGEKGKRRLLFLAQGEQTCRLLC